jgi:hypothetical protein
MADATCSCQRPFLNYYGSTFILYELSSPFLNIHWFFDKLHMTGSKAQWYNGILLLASFFSCRLVWGTYQSVRVYQDVWRALQSGPMNVTEGIARRMTSPLVLGVLNDGKGVVKANEEVLKYAEGNVVPTWLAVTYLSSNLVLNSLNFYWFGKMVETVRSRFRSTEGAVKKEKVMVEGVEVDVDIGGDGTVLTNVEDEIKRGLDWEGKKSVIVERKEVRRRKA